MKYLNWKMLCVISVSLIFASAYFVSISYYLIALIVGIGGIGYGFKAYNWPTAITETKNG
tara:strand:+ start:19159 stop:19338 length:180 start_codon:yes stop_codon:yes gene_type:complete